METTSWDLILNRFFKRLEKDEDFFNYYNISIKEAEKLAESRAEAYLSEVLDEMNNVCTPVPFVNFSDYDDVLRVVNYKMHNCDIKLVVDLMFTKYMEKDIPLLHAFQVNFTPTDLNVFSPANERNTYNNMIETLNKKNDISIDKFNSTNRETGKRITIDYNSYEL